MKKLKKLSLTRLNESVLDKKQQQLILGGGCICGSCGQYASTNANAIANYDGGITGTGTNSPLCVCNGQPDLDNTKNSW